MNTLVYQRKLNFHLHFIWVRSFHLFVSHRNFHCKSILAVFFLHFRFFITQNGPAKGGIRFGPTMIDLMSNIHSTSSAASASSSEDCVATVSMAFAYAALLRWLTPSSSTTTTNGIFTGWLQGATRSKEVGSKDDASTVQYADGLRYNLQEGWYEFKCACTVHDGTDARNLSEWLAILSTDDNDGNSHNPRQPSIYIPAIHAYLVSKEGGDLASLAIGRLIVARQLSLLTSAVATLYARMVAGDDMMSLLQEMVDRKHGYVDGLHTSASCLVEKEEEEDEVRAKRKPLNYRLQHLPDESRLMSVRLDVESISAVVTSEVKSAIAIDLHTHLLPPSHGSLCLWGIDELLTYVSTLIKKQTAGPLRCEKISVAVVAIPIVPPHPHKP